MHLMSISKFFKIQYQWRLFIKGITLIILELVLFEA